MKVFKFGGASVKDAEGVRNLSNIISKEPGRPLVVVISAMGKTTNALELLLRAALQIEGNNKEAYYQQIKNYHFQICKQLFPEGHKVYEILENTFSKLEMALASVNRCPYNEAYDRVVGYGEIISTQIISAYLSYQNISHLWIDARDFIRTDSNWRMAEVDLEKTRNSIRSLSINDAEIVITQGFIGSDHQHRMVTLGRAGSDYTAALFAWALGAESLTLWKDVPGVMSADPVFYSDAETFTFIPYREAIELTYYGASVIHPKTIKPLQDLGIPLFVKSFKDPSLPGTKIAAGEHTIPAVPSRVRKYPQVLVTLRRPDLAFVDETMIATVLHEYHQSGLRINLMQNSALSLSVCADYDPFRFEPLLQNLSQLYSLKYNTNLTLLTIRHYKHNPQIIEKETLHRRILVEQRSRSTAQFVFGN